MEYNLLSKVFKKYDDYLSSPIKLFINHPTITDIESIYNIQEELKDNIINEIYIGDDKEVLANILNIPLSDYYIFDDSNSNVRDNPPLDYNQYLLLPKNEVTLIEGKYYHNGNLIANTIIVPYSKHLYFSDILKYNHCYIYNHAENKYSYTENRISQIKSFYKGITSVVISNAVGGSDSRISDYGRLIQYILKNSEVYHTLPETLKEIVDLIHPDEDTITRIMGREKTVYDLKQKVLKEGRG